MCNDSNCTTGKESTKEPLPSYNQHSMSVAHDSMPSYLLFQACSISQSPCFLAIRDSKTDCSCWGVSNDDESSLAWIFSVQFRNSPSSICHKKNHQCSVPRVNTRSEWLLHILCSLWSANTEVVYYLLLGKEVFHLLFPRFAESIRFQRSKAIINSKIYLWHPVNSNAKR